MQNFSGGVIKKSIKKQISPLEPNPLSAVIVPVVPVIDSAIAPDLLHRQINSISGYLEAISQLSPESVAFWYRGHSKTSHKLVPTLYRNSNGRTEDELRKVEEKLNRRFRDRSMPYSLQARDESSDSSVVHSWWRLFTMQHYGTPTRLLDWSENAMTALCFSVFGAVTSSPCAEDAVVWVLDPAMWNKIGNSNHESALSVDEHGAGPYSPLPSLHQHVSTNWPLAIFGMHNSPRIATQQGTFVIFSPGKVKPMEAHALDAPTNGRPAMLRAITIDKLAIASIAAALKRLGFMHSSLYPDLHGLSTDLKKEFGY